MKFFMVRVFNCQFFQSSVFFRSLFCLVSDLSNIVLQDLDYASMYDPRTCFKDKSNYLLPKEFNVLELSATESPKTLCNL